MLTCFLYFTWLLTMVDMKLHENFFTYYTSHILSSYGIKFSRICVSTKKYLWPYRYVYSYNDICYINFDIMHIYYTCISCKIMSITWFCDIVVVHHSVICAHVYLYNEMCTTYIDSISLYIIYRYITIHKNLYPHYCRMYTLWL